MNRSWIPYILIGALGLYAGVVTTCYSRESRNRKIAESNEKAALDTTRITLVGQLAAASHLLEQKDTRIKDLGGALEQSLKERRSDVRVIQGLKVTIDSLKRSSQHPDTQYVTVDSSGDSTRTAKFTQKGPPIEGEQIVTVPPPPRSILLDSDLRVTPFSVRYGLGCDKDRTPVASFETPPWVKIGFEKGSVDTRICNPKSNPFSISLKPDMSKGIYFVFGGILGWLIGH